MIFASTLSTLKHNNKWGYKDKFAVTAIFKVKMCIIFVSTLKQ